MAKKSLADLSKRTKGSPGVSATRTVHPKVKGAPAPVSKEPTFSEPTLPSTDNPDLKEDFSEIERDNGIKDHPLPEFELPAHSEQVKKAFVALMAQMDLVYFSSQRIAVCTKKFEKSCLMTCQHFGYCKAKANTKDLIKII